MRIAAILLTVVCAAPALFAQAPARGADVAQAPARSADALARALQARYERVRDFSADFEQTYRGGVLRTLARERGTVIIKKPGRMRWTYTHPEKKEIVSDGQKLHMYFPQDRRVIVNDVPPDGGANTGAMFLAGRGDVSRDFTARFAENQPDGMVALQLTPRQTQAEYDHLVVGLDPATLQIRSLATLDRLGGENALSFSNLKENRGVADRVFEFRIPSGVTVTDGTGN